MKWKYRIIEHAGFLYSIEYKSCGFIGYFFGWEVLKKNLNYEQARTYCKDQINKEKERINPKAKKIMEVFTHESRI